MTTKYMLVRKSKKGNWKPCEIADDNGIRYIGAVSSDQVYVQGQRDRIARIFPAQKYAVLEITEE